MLGLDPSTVGAVAGLETGAREAAAIGGCRLALCVVGSCHDVDWLDWLGWLGWLDC